MVIYPVDFPWNLELETGYSRGYVRCKKGKEAI